VRNVVEQSSKLRLVYLPTYSSELNLIERVWRYFKKKVLYNKYYENLADFRKATIKLFQNFGDYANDLESLLGGGFEGHNLPKFITLWVLRAECRRALTVKKEKRFMAIACR